MTDDSGLERRWRLLLRAYPRAWRREREDEMLAVLSQEAAADGRAAIGVSAVLDIIGHGLEARLDRLVRWLPERLRRQVASAALVAAAGLSLLLLAGEIIGARYRDPGTWSGSYGGYFMSGPFLSIGVGLYLALMSAALLVVLGRPGLARLLLLLASAYAAWMAMTGGQGYPVPRLPLLVLAGGLGLLAGLTTLDVGRRGRRGLSLAGVGYVASSAVALLLTKPVWVLGWSVGTMTTSRSVAMAALAVASPAVGGAVLLVAALCASGTGAGRTKGGAGWPAALAIAALPIVAFATMTAVVVNPPAVASRAWIPVAYVGAVALVAIVARHRRRLTTR